MTDHTDTIFRDRVKHARSRLLDVVDTMVEQMAAKYETPPKPPLPVARRAFANTVRLWKFCDLSRCRRAQCCRGEPRNCLRIGLTLLPPEAFDSLMQRTKGSARRERKRRKAVA